LIDTAALAENPRWPARRASGVVRTAWCQPVGMICTWRAARFLSVSGYEARCRPSRWERGGRALWSISGQRPGAGSMPWTCRRTRLGGRGSVGAACLRFYSIAGVRCGCFPSTLGCAAGGPGPPSRRARNGRRSRGGTRRAPSSSAPSPGYSRATASTPGAHPPNPAQASNVTTRRAAAANTDAAHRRQLWAGEPLGFRPEVIKS
jgi:hypothetical protein